MFSMPSAFSSFAIVSTLSNVVSGASTLTGIEAILFVVLIEPNDSMKSGRSSDASSLVRTPSS